jgi:hypothetical protein
MYVNGELGVFGMQLGPTSGPVHAEKMTKLAEAMNKLATNLGGEANPNYAPQVLDLSMFPSY